MECRTGVIPEFRSRTVRTFSSLGSRDTFACTLEMKDGTGWRPVFTADFASEYGNERVFDVVYVRMDLSEMILRETVNPSREETPIIEDHGGSHTGSLPIAQYTWWKSFDGGATWCVRDGDLEPTPERYLKADVEVAE